MERGDVVTVRGRIGPHKVLKVEEQKAIIELPSGDTSWWPINELTVINPANQEEMFSED